MSTLPGPRGTRMFVEASGDTPLVWFEVCAQSGASSDPFGVEGLTRHASMLARRGAGDLDRAALDEALDGLGAVLDVAAGRDTVTLSGLCLTRNLDRVVDLAADVLAAPRFEALEHERLLRETPQVIDEIHDDDSSLATRWFDRECAPGHAYARTSVGTTASLARIDRDAAAATWRRLFVPRNVLIGVAGDVDEDRAATIAQRLVERLPDGPPPPLPAFDEGAAPRGRRLVVVDKADRTQAQLRLGHLGPRWGGDDTPAMLLLETAFGGMFSSRLMQEIRVKRGWSYGAGCSLRRSRGAHWFEMWMATAIEVAGDAAALTLQLYGDLVARGLTADEIDFARSYLVGSMPFHLATARQRMQLAVRDVAFGLAPDYTATLPDRLADLGVDEVRAAAARHLRPDDVVTVAVTTAADASDALTQATGAAATIVAHDAY
ncbi:MAG: insulinase family protein [Kofleriaceae bacterium]|nr:insulinase family protein [Myxococcales bacterium]MCB9563249.1 insulinase family protein [Kofleriaceae bacterium]